MHRFGIDSLNDLLIHTPALREHKLEGENQEQIFLINEVININTIFNTKRCLCGINENDR